MNLLQNYLGIVYPPTDIVYSNSAGNTPADTVAVNNNPLWPLMDWAWSPVWQPATTNEKYIELRFSSAVNAYPNGVTFNCLVIDCTITLQWQSLWLMEIANNYMDNYNRNYLTNNPYRILSGSMTSTQYGNFLAPHRTIFVFDTPITANYVRITMWPQDNSQKTNVGEVGVGMLVPMQNNPELSMRRRASNINQHNFVMQNGRQSTTVYGNITDNIELTYKWSDDGALAIQLYDLISKCAQYGAPLFWVPPVKNSSEIATRQPEYIALQNYPVIQNLATTVWQLDIDGRCQP